MNESPRIAPAPQTTGRYLVVLDDNDMQSGIQAIGHSTGLTDFAHAADFEDSAIAPNQLPSSTSLVLDNLGVAVLSLDPDQAQSLQSGTRIQQQTPILEPERIVYTTNQNPFRPPLPPASSDLNLSITLSLDYLKGYRDAIHHLVEHLTQSQIASGSEGTPEEPDLTEYTWGLLRTQVDSSCYTGAGVRVAVLDTGLDLTHPDFVGRAITSKSFITGETAQDANGHGTHCIGTACGSRIVTPPQYGVAYDAEIFAGKVLSDAGSGSDGGILAGINWAIANRCSIISMSLGAPVQKGQHYSRVYELVGKRSLRRGSLIIAAAGNDSWRQMNVIQPVSHPANCPSIMAVGAIDSRLGIAPFSNRGLNAKGGQVDIVGPGVDVYSTWPMPTRYNTISGTSMATPHVAGIAALFVEATDTRGNDLWAQLTQSALRLPAASSDVGSGLVQAIQ